MNDIKCNCSGNYLCIEAERLRNRYNDTYELAWKTENWNDYEEARLNWLRHRGVNI